jgi:hypothetical protein
MSRRAITAFVLAALTPSTSAAGPPSAANSTIPSHVLLVGLDAGVPHSAMGEFVIVVRDLADIPESDRLVEVRFQVCPGARIASDQAQAAVSSQCATHGITSISDVDGVVRMTAVGAGDPSAPHGAGPCASVYAGGVFLGLVAVSYLDQDGASGLGAGDLSVWLSDFVTGDPIGRSDYDGNGSLGALDLSLWLTAYASGGQVHSPTQYCP